ncbi:MAG: translation initiation factor [Epsilonproteobacteria bacterium]|nr:translation initiation factor [Campylobacterota bacterium]
MAKGKKLNIFIGANIDNDWAEIQTPKVSKKSTAILEPQKHFLVFKKEKRRGKTVTLVGEFQLTKDEALSILKELKKKLGCGGAFKDGWMEFQGELKEKLRPLLINLSFRFKNNN